MIPDDSLRKFISLNDYIFNNIKLIQVIELIKRMRELEIFIFMKRMLA